MLSCIQDNFKLFIQNREIPIKTRKTLYMDFKTVPTNSKKFKEFLEDSIKKKIAQILEYLGKF